MTDQQTLRSEASGNSSPTTNDIWRKEIHARVSGYRTRRGRRIEGAFSMRFPFPPLEPDVSSSVTIAPAEPPNQEPLVEASTATAAQTSATEDAVAEICDVEPELAAAEPEVVPMGPELSPTEVATLPEMVLD